MMMTVPRAAAAEDGSPGLDEDIAALFSLDAKDEPATSLDGCDDTDGNCTDTAARVPARGASKGQRA